MVDIGWADPDESQPVPGLAHGAIPGLLGVMLSGGKRPRAIGSQPFDMPLSGLPPAFDMPLQEDFRSSVPGRGIGSDHVAGGPPPPPPPARGIGSDYAASSGLGLPQGGGIGSDYAAGGGAPPAPPPGSGQPPQAPLFMQSGVQQALPMQPQQAPQGPAPAPNAELPPNAAPAMGEAPPPDNSPIPKDSLLGRLFSHLGDFRDKNKMTLLAMAGGLAGAPSLGTGLGRAFQAAVPAQRMDIAQNQINMTAKALVAKGFPPDMAAAAAGNPAILQQILPQVFGAKQRKFTQIGEDLMGNKRFGFVDEASNKVYDLTGNEISHTQQGTHIPTGPDGQPLQGEELRSHIARVDPVAAAALKDMYEGKQNPNARNLQKLAPLASLVYPGFDATDYPNRLKLRNSYTSGADHKELEAINTVSGHMGKLMDSADKLGNTGFKPWNYLKNMVADKTFGSPELVKFRNDLVTTQNELAKAYHGGHVSDAAFAAFNKSINEMQTPEELKAAIGELAGLLHSKINTKENSYRIGMQHAPLPQEYSAMSDEAKHAFTRINEWSKGIKPQAGAAPHGAGASAAPMNPSTRGQAATSAASDLVRQNGHVYQRQSDGSYRAIQ